MSLMARLLGGYKTGFGLGAFEWLGANDGIEMCTESLLSLSFATGSWLCENCFWPPGSLSVNRRIGKDGRPEQVFAGTGSYRPETNFLLG